MDELESDGSRQIELVKGTNRHFVKIVVLGRLSREGPTSAPRRSVYTIEAISAGGSCPRAASRSGRDERSESACRSCLIDVLLFGVEGVEGFVRAIVVCDRTGRGANGGVRYYFVRLAT